MNTFCILKRIVKRSVAACVMLSMAVVMHGQECPAIGLPFEEDFETFNATTKLPDCWTKWENFDVPEMKAHVVSTPVYAGNGALMMSCGANNDTAHICYVMGPVLSQSPSGIRLKAKFRATEAGAVVQVGVTKSTSSAQRHFGFTPVTTLTIPTANVWITYEIDFTSYTGDGDRPAFMMSQKMQNGHVARKVYIDEVALDRTYLFYMVGVSKTSPYESVYRTDDATLFGPTCLQVRKAYEDQGVAFERRASEPEDHLGLEFSFCATLLGRVSEQLAAGDDERARETLAAVATFLSEHPLVFAPIYLDHVATRAKSAYYRSIAGICRGTLESLARDLDVAPAETLDASALEIS